MRPTSPHLQVYKLPLPAYMSIFHRITGIGLAFGSILFFGWLFALSFGYVNEYNTLIQTPIAQLFCFGVLFSGCYHFFNGIRHLIWDLGFLLEMQHVYLTGYVVIGLSLISTFLLWFF
jgi:succinate dehydrogenase / fumarate reductase cytochrome b subunit